VGIKYLKFLSDAIRQDTLSILGQWWRFRWGSYY